MDQTAAEVSYVGGAWQREGERLASGATHVCTETHELGASLAKRGQERRRGGELVKRGKGRESALARGGGSVDETGRTNAP